MRIKELFTVPEGKKITERIFGRVLISSVLSMLLCMVCLISTTWALFTVSVENEGNEIQIATVKPILEVKRAGEPIAAIGDYSYTLEQGNYTVEVQVENDATATDDLNRTRGNVYILLTIANGSETKSVYFTFANGDVSRRCDLQLATRSTVTADVSWIAPASAQEIVDGTVVTG